jgi:hypothetical protein
MSNDFNKNLEKTVKKMINDKKGFINRNDDIEGTFGSAGSINRSYITTTNSQARFGTSNGPKVGP